MDYFNEIEKVDGQVADILKDEIHRQQNVLELIPSENIVTNAVLQAMGSVFTNKYSEGYPNKRYYGGNQFVDLVEQLAIDRAKHLFNAEHANVQPHSGSSANMAVYNALLNPNDCVLGMSLSDGGHLTHGHSVNFSGRTYKFFGYGVKESDCTIDYDNLEKLAKLVKPKMIVCGASAYSREIDFKRIGEICKEAGCLMMADISHISGLVIAKIHQSPFPYADIVTTTTHKTLAGPRGGIILCKKEYSSAIDKAVFPGMQGGPLENIIAAKAVAFYQASKPEFIEYQKNIVINSKKLANELIEKGYKIVSGGTDNHLFLLDLSSIEMGGKTAEDNLDKVNITVNKNMIPFDKRKPTDPSGIRMGTPTITSRGMKEKEMVKVAQYIDSTLRNIGNEAELSKIKLNVEELCKEFPIYQ